MADVRLVDVGADNWRACAALRVTDDQRQWVADVSYYLCLCAYGDTWRPWAIEADRELVGFLMWGADEDASRWVGGLVVDSAQQGRGIGRAAMIEAVRLLTGHEGCTGIALSVSPENRLARSLYARLGFVETGETAEDGAEMVSRLSVAQAQRLLAGDDVEASG